MLRLIHDSLRSVRASDWVEYWVEHWAMFERLNQAFLTLIEYAYDDASQRVIEQGNDLCRSRITKKLPQLEQQIRESETKILDACQTALEFRALQDPKLRAVDTECASRFMISTSWFNIAINSLHGACELPQLPELASFLVEFLRQVADAALRATRAATELRAASAAEHVMLSATIKPAEDGYGYVGAVPQLEIETCAETRDEMKDLLADLVRGYFEAEKKRGTLSDTLSGLDIPGHPRKLLVSLYVHDGNETMLTDVVPLAL